MISHSLSYINPGVFRILVWLSPWKRCFLIHAQGDQLLERKTRPPEQLNCPRCNSTNTKFCYYNNYSLTQPRYFCKTCRRYWTEGGSLRNVPVGGGQQDLNLGFPPMQPSHGLSQYIQVAKVENNDHQQKYPSASALGLLRTGMASRGLNSFVPAPEPDSTTPYSTGFSMQDYKPALTFSIDGLENRAAGIHGIQENGGRVFFPFGEMKPISTNITNEVDQNKDQGNSAGYWTNGMFGGGGGSW
ncbi:hypothetical protein GOBAR_DD35577 [Gossypium barbadense]|nr:hypothetical protein GOBAR_DD35577 [Gossypium barbadense]